MGEVIGFVQISISKLYVIWTVETLETVETIVSSLLPALTITPNTMSLTLRVTIFEILALSLIPYIGGVQQLCSGCSGVIVDTDCGADDAMAISLLLSAEAAGHTSSWGKVLAFTTVTGNTGALNVSRNVKTLLNVLGRSEIPVYRGMEDGLSVHIPPTEFYGSDGLGDFLPSIKPTPVTPSNMSAGLYLATMVQNNPGRITILCIGPLTNLAMATHFYDNFLNDIRHILILGGDYKGGGNMSPGIEANMYSDPDAASFFFSKIPPQAADKITLIPLETIQDIRFPMSYRLEILGLHNSTLMNFLNRAERIGLSKYGSSWPCYDPTAASLLLDSNLALDFSLAWVEVAVQGPRGAMFAKLNGQTLNVNVVTKLNQARLSNILEHYLTSS